MASEKKAKAKIDALEQSIEDYQKDADPSLVVTAVELAGLHQQLYTAKAQYARLTDNADKAAKWDKMALQHGELKVKAAKALAADEARKAIEEEEFDAETRRLGLALVK